MPQWFRDRTRDSAKYPDERWVAHCSRGDAPQLLRHDHHVVRIRGRAALLRTYQWAAEEVERWPAEMLCEVSFTYAPGHPAAPPEIQRLVDSLTFVPLSDSTPQADEH